MALPAVVGLIGKIAAIPGVQQGATRIASDVYGRLMKRKEPAAEPAPLALAPEDKSHAAIIARLDDMATRDELIASFATLQAELDRRHQRTGLLLTILVVLQAVVIGALLLR